MFDLLRLNRDVLTLAILIPLNNVGFLDRAFLLRHLLVLDPLAALTTQLMKVDLTFSLCGRKKLNAEGNERDLDLT
jgi:hypothetical protein